MYHGTMQQSGPRPYNQAAAYAGGGNSAPSSDDTAGNAGGNRFGGNMGGKAMAYGKPKATRGSNGGASSNGTGEAYTSKWLDTDHAWWVFGDIVNDNHKCLCGCGASYRSIVECKGSESAVPNGTGGASSAAAVGGQCGGASPALPKPDYHGTSTDPSVQKAWLDAVMEGKKWTKNKVQTAHQFYTAPGITGGSRVCLFCKVTAGQLAFCPMYKNPMSESS